jgi:hypothetical protein
MAFPEVIIVPVRSAAEFEHVAKTLSAFEAMFGVTPVVAFAPPGCGLLAMSTPPSRSVSKENTYASDSVGRVVNGAVVWPRASLRGPAGLGPLTDADSQPNGDSSLVVSAMSQRSDGIGWNVLDEQFDVDENGFLRLRLDHKE